MFKLPESPIELAREMGAVHRTQYIAEYGTWPVEDRVGLWDINGWKQVLWAIDQRFTDPDHDACRAEYRAALFGHITAD